MSKNKVLITGSKGLLGLALLNTAPKNVEIIPAVLNNTSLDIGNHKFISLDITKANQVKKMISKVKPNVIIHTASLGNVDYCQKNQKEAYKVNVLGTANIIKACQREKCKLIYISSNAIFDGLSAPYDESSFANPSNYYGQTKAEAEELVTDFGLNYLIIRLLLMYGWNHSKGRMNPVTWLLSRLKSGEKTNLVTDIFNNPIHNVEAAKAIWKAIKVNLTGVVCLAGKDRVNRYEFGLSVADVFGLDPQLIKPVTSDFFSNITPRMPDTTYKTGKMEKELGLFPISVTKGLQAMKHSQPSL